MSRVCPYCSQPFVGSRFRPAQIVCSQAECQRQRRRQYHRHKIRTDSVYRETCRNSQKQWRANHPDYCKQYGQQHPASVEQNRQRQQRRDQSRRLVRLAKNNLAFDLKRSCHELWLMGPEASDLAKNNVAFSKVLIFQTVQGSFPTR